MVKEILRPRTVAEAVRMRSRPDSAYLGGGTWLNSMHAVASASLISLENLGLGSIQKEDSRCVVGATVTFQQAIDSVDAPRAVRDALALTASRTLRNMSTIGGELALRLPQSVLLPVLLALDAGVRLATRRKPIGFEEFLRDHWEDLVLEVLLQDAFRPCGVARLSRTSHSPRSLVVAVSRRSTVAGDGSGPVLRGLRLVAGDCQGQPVRLREVEDALEGEPLPPRDGLEEMIRAAFSPRPDMHASAEYKKYMAGVLAAELLRVSVEGETSG
jgi:putative selenate reductase FAD-binding subunit